MKYRNFTSIDFWAAKYFPAFEMLGQLTPSHQKSLSTSHRKILFLLLPARIYLPELSLLFTTCVGGIGNEWKSSKCEYFRSPRGIRRFPDYWKVLTVTVIGRHKWNIFICQKIAKCFNFSAELLMKRSRIKMTVCVFSHRSIVKLVTCGFAKCDRNIGFYGLLNVFT